MYINGSPVLHIIDKAIRFQAARWLENITAQYIWDMLWFCWINTYLGPLDLIVYDTGTNFTATEFQQNAQILSIRTKAVPTKAAQSIGIVERYHAPLRRAYKVISEELAGIRPDRLVPTLLVFGLYPWLSESDPPSPSIT